MAQLNEPRYARPKLYLLATSGMACGAGGALSVASRQPPISITKKMRLNVTPEEFNKLQNWI
jgi:hypothetical protein